MGPAQSVDERAAAARRTQRRKEETKQAARSETPGALVPTAPPASCAGSSTDCKSVTMPQQDDTTIELFSPTGKDSDLGK